MPSGTVKRPVIAYVSCIMNKARLLLLLSLCLVKVEAAEEATISIRKISAENEFSIPETWSKRFPLVDRNNRVFDFKLFNPFPNKIEPSTHSLVGKTHEYELKIISSELKGKFIHFKLQVPKNIENGIYHIKSTTGGATQLLKRRVLVRNSSNDQPQKSN